MKKLLAVFLVLFASLALANPIDQKCPQHVIWGAPQAKDGNNQYLCKTGYAANYSYTTKVSTYVVEKIVGSTLIKSTARKDDFREDPEVPAQFRSILTDYQGTGYDRGHMAPAADFMFDANMMSESFFLTNMMPQVPGNNRGIWKYLEEMTRYWAQTKGEVYVITGTIYTQPSKIIGKGVSVPSHVYKIVIDPKTGKTASFLFPNEKLDPKLIDQYAVSVLTIEQKTGINFSPTVPAKFKNTESTIVTTKDF
jgi:endonuclease G